VIESRISGKDKAPWLRCRGCKKSYWAQNWHCQRCHETLNEVTAWHWQDRACVPPSRMNWELDNDDVWVER
jgi:hypothetical protein